MRICIYFKIYGYFYFNIRKKTKFVQISYKEEGMNLQAPLLQLSTTNYDIYVCTL